MNSDLTRTVTRPTMQHLRLLATCLLVVLMSLSQVATASELTPLPSADREALSAVRADPLPKTLTQGIHFWVSDEAHHHLFRDTLKGRGGVYVGIGTNQNFAMAAWQRPELIVLLDFDQSIIDLHAVYAVIFAHATTPEEHLAMWSRKQAKEVRALLVAAMPGEGREATRQRDRALRAYKYGRGRVSRGLTKMKTRYTTWGEPSFINDQAEYDWVRAMSMAGRIVAIRGDLTGPHTLSDLGATLKAQGRKVTTFYMSNTEQYFRYTPRFKANMTTLPLTEDAVMLRTRAWRVGGLPKPGKKKKPLYYAYVVQSFTDWVTWLEAPKIHGVRDILTRETRVKNALVTVGAHPSQKSARP